MLNSYEKWVYLCENLLTWAYKSLWRNFYRWLVLKCLLKSNHNPWAEDAKNGIEYNANFILRSRGEVLNVIGHLWHHKWSAAITALVGLKINLGPYSEYLLINSNGQKICQPHPCSLPDSERVLHPPVGTHRCISLRQARWNIKPNPWRPLDQIDMFLVFKNI